MSFPNPCFGVMHWIIVTGRQAASAAKAKKSSSPNELCMIADSVRTLIEVRATVPATMPVINMTFDLSRMGVPHIVERSQELSWYSSQRNELDCIMERLTESLFD